MAQIEIDHNALAHFCRANKIAKLALFGSVLRDDFAPQSDVDVLVEFEPGKEPGLFGIARMEREMLPFFGGRKVDLRTSGDLGRYMRARVLKTAEGIYAA